MSVYKLKYDTGPLGSVSVRFSTVYILINEKARRSDKNHDGFLNDPTFYNYTDLV
jgi:hypothetical protein